MTAQLTSDQHGNNETDLETMLSKHQELKTEIDTMHKNFANLHTTGQNLLSAQHYAAEIIKEKLEELQQDWTELLKSCEDRTTKLGKRKNAENMNREVSQLEAWLLNQESELSSNEVGSCLENVEELLKKHDEMERMLLAQEERFLGLIQSSDNALEYNVDNAEKEVIVNQVGESFPVKLVDDSTNSLSISSNIPTSNKHDTPEIRDLSELNSKNIENVPNFGLQGDRAMQNEQFSEPDFTSSQRTIDTIDERTDETSIILDEMPVTTEDRHIKAENRQLNPDTESSDAGISEFIDFESTPVVEKLPTSLSTKDFIHERIKRKPPMIPNTRSLYKEPLSASNRILGVSPLYAGTLQRKQEMNVLGQRSVAQPWRSYYTVLSEDELHFFKDLEGFKSKWHVSKPMSLVAAFCEQVTETSRQGYIFRVILCDKSEYYFATENEEEMRSWMVKINSVIKMAARYGSSDGIADYDGDNGKANLGGSESRSDNGGQGGSDDDYDNDEIGDEFVHVCYGDSDSGIRSYGGHDDHYDGDGHDFHNGDTGVDVSRHKSRGLSGQNNFNRNTTTINDTDVANFNNRVRPPSNHTNKFKDVANNTAIPGYDKLDKEHLASYDPKETSTRRRSSDTPMIVITDTNTNNEFLMEEENYTDSDEHIQLSDDDTMSLPEHSDYDQPSWYQPGNNSDSFAALSIQDNDSTTDKPNGQMPLNNGTSPTAIERRISDTVHGSDSFQYPTALDVISSPSSADIDSFPAPDKPMTSTHLLNPKDDNGNGPPPPVPNTPPSSIPVSDIDLPPELPETSPPESPEGHLSDVLDFIPPPVLDPFFDFLVDAKDEMEENESMSANGAKPAPTTRPQPETKSGVSTSSRFTPQRVAPPPPPRPSVSLLSDMGIPISIQTARKQHERKEEKKGLFSGIFKRKK